VSANNIDHELLMRAVRRHTKCKWALLYIERWLKAPVRMSDGALIMPERGTPQGSVISPILANLFLHYAFDRWMQEKHPEIPFERYADDAICHCSSEAQARSLRAELQARIGECQLELHPQKTQIVYCKDANRTGDYPAQRFDFLGYSFRPRRSMNRNGKLFVSFAPAISDKAAKAIRQSMRRWKLHRRNDLALADIARWTRPFLLGWIRYYGRFHRSALSGALRTLNSFIVRWAQRKYKRLRGHGMRAWEWLRGLQARQPTLFAHWLSEFAVGR
jgi:group II intron reverse transcriptase/maturase